MFLSRPQKSLLKKGPSFVPTPSDVNWLMLRKDFDKFVNQLRYQLKYNNQQSSSLRSELQPYCSSNNADMLEHNTNTQVQLPSPPPERVYNNTPTNRTKGTYNKGLRNVYQKS